MRVLKPQHALIQTAPTQFGTEAVLGISVGCGFRLSDPFVLAHEASVWHAFTAAPLTTPIMEIALPKQHAEWLLGGHAVAMVDERQIGMPTDWVADVSLAGVRKAVSCAALAERWQDAAGAATQGRACLAIDYPHAMKDLRGKRNPVGMAAPAALQLAARLGPVGEPLAAMGPIEARWESRAELAPSRPSTLDQFGRDGTHMGWPLPMDLRYFQIAPPDQRQKAEEWPLGAAFELRGVGPRGEGYQGKLPRLQAQVLVRKRGAEAMEAVRLMQQTVWFLPDQDTGVIWWHGAVAIDSVLSNEVELAVVALREAGHLLPAGHLAALIAARPSREQMDVPPLKDSDLLPERARGWAWELILNAEDHPSLKREPLSHGALQTRIDEFEASLAQVQRDRQKVRALEEDAIKAPWKGGEATAQPLPSASRNWRAAFAGAPGAVLSDMRLDGANLARTQVRALRLERVRFQDADLSESSWSQCHFEDVAFTASDLSCSRWQDCTFVRCRFLEVDLNASRLSHCRLQCSNFDDCIVAHAHFAGGEWTQASLQRLRGEHLVLRNAQWENVSWLDCELPRAQWLDIDAHDLSIVRCKVLQARIDHCKLKGLSAVDTDLRGSDWRGCAGASVNFVEGSNLEAASMLDCWLEKSSWLSVKADGIQVECTTLRPWIAQGLHAPGSRWERCVLSEANLMHADLSAATIHATSLKDANLYGANLMASKITHSNLIRLQFGMAHGAEAVMGKGNLRAGSQAIPRRSS